MREVNFEKRYRVEARIDPDWYWEYRHSFHWRWVAKMFARSRSSLGVLEYRIIDTKGEES